MAAAIALVSCGTQKKTNITSDAVREGQSTTEEKIVAEKAEEGSGVSMISSSEVRRHDYGGHEAFSLELLEKVNVNPAANVAATITVDANDWNNAVIGEYTDTLTFTVNVVTA